MNSEQRFWPKKKRFSKFEILEEWLLLNFWKRSTKDLIYFEIRVNVFSSIRYNLNFLKTINIVFLR